MSFNPDLDYKLLLAVPLIPLVGYVLQIFFGRFLPRKGDWLVTGGMFFVMCITVFMFAKAIRGGEEFFTAFRDGGGPEFRWFYTGDKPAELNAVARLMYDPLGAAMLAVVGIVSFFVHLFSIGYMHGDRRYHIFFANISLFTFAMLGLILSDSLLFLFIFWELMGLMSYLLIGHFSHDPDSPRIVQAAAACKKAFLTTRVGDCCLLIGMIMLYYHFHTFEFTEMWRMTQEAVAANGGDYPAWLTTAGLFIFGGTVGKSAQFPLHIWLPDAMEGPTPVSAMIHAATMVAAGVFLLGRTFPLLSPEVLGVITAVGGITAIFAATIGCTVNDIKGVLAYSTISQLGFMVAAIGTGGLGLVAGLFHMVTHAFFKACLFLSAGSVIHGCHHEQDMQKMGGLRKKMPLTFIAMLTCTLAISGMPLFSGFYSKDRIIQSAIQSTFAGGTFRGSSAFATIALALAASLTAFYMFRLIFLTFFGEARDHHIYEHAHESPKTITISLLALAIFGLLGGHFWLGGDFIPHHTWFTNLVSAESMYPGITLTNYNEVSASLEHASHTAAMAVSTIVMASGIGLAFWIYFLRKTDPARITDALGEIYTTVKNKYYIDEIVNASLIKGTMTLAAAQSWFDAHIVDGVVLTVGKVNKATGFVSAWFDRTIIDGIVNLVGTLAHGFGYVIRLFQTGRIQQYVSFAVAGGILAAAVFILS